MRSPRSCASRGSRSRSDGGSSRRIRPALARWEGDGPAGSTARVTYRLAAEDGGTRFDYENEFALPGGALGRAAGAVLSAAPGAREARRSLERLRALLEDGPASG